MFSESASENAGLQFLLKGVSTPKELAAVETRASALKYDTLKAALAQIAKPVDG